MGDVVLSSPRPLRPSASGLWLVGVNCEQSHRGKMTHHIHLYRNMAVGRGSLLRLTAL